MKIAEYCEQFRVLTGAYGTEQGDDFGAFIVPGPCGVDLRVLASPGDANLDIPWEHVSVSLPKRCPNWPEMCFIKDLFWDEEQAVMQFHPPKSEYVNNHNFCLHMWRPMDGVFPMPPKIAV